MADTPPPDAAAGGGGGEPVAPQVVATDGGVWGQTSITALWVPVLVGSHLFAGFWLVQAWRHSNPRARARRSSAAGARAAAEKPSVWAKLRPKAAPGKKVSDVAGDGAGSSESDDCVIEAVSSDVESGALPAADQVQVRWLLGCVGSACGSVFGAAGSLWEWVDRLQKKLLVETPPTRPPNDQKTPDPPDPQGP
jgi:hypothetical protein